MPHVFSLLLLLPFSHPSLSLHSFLLPSFILFFLRQGRVAQTSLKLAIFQPQFNQNNWAFWVLYKKCFQSDNGIQEKRQTHLEAMGGFPGQENVNLSTEHTVERQIQARAPSPIPLLGVQNFDPLKHFYRGSCTIFMGTKPASSWY